MVFYLALLELCGGRRKTVVRRGGKRISLGIGQGKVLGE